LCKFLFENSVAYIKLIALRMNLNQEIAPSFKKFSDPCLKPQPLILNQGFTNWGTCTPKDRLSYLKGYI